jgi:transposase
LLDHRDDLVAERRRAQQRLRWHLHELEPSLVVPLGALDRAVWLDRLARRLARSEQTTQVRIELRTACQCEQVEAASAALSPSQLGARADRRREP